MDFLPEFLPQNENINSKKQYDAKTNFVPAHLSMPIFNDECNLLSNKSLHWICQRHKKMSNTLKNIKGLGVLLDKTNNPRLCVKTWARSFNKNRDLKCLYPALETWAMQKIAFLSNAVEGGILSADDIINDCKAKSEAIKHSLHLLQNDYDSCRSAEYIKDKICHREIKIGEFLKFNTLLVERDVCVLTCACHGANLLPTTILIDSLDQLQGRFSLRLNWLLSDIFNKYTVSILQKGDRLIHYFEHLQNIIGNDVYAVLSVWESLVIGWSILHEDDIGFADLYDSQREEMENIFSKYDFRPFYELLLPENYSSEQVCMQMELLGISKHFGYPVLKIEKLLDPLRQYGTVENVPINQEYVNKVLGVARRDMCFAHKKKHGSYPAFQEIPHELYPYLRKNKDVPRELHKEYLIWSKVIFKKTFEYDYTPSLVELLKDSSCAPTMNAWGSLYDKCGFSVLYGKEPPMSAEEHSETPLSTIMAYLTSDDDAVKKIIDDREDGKFNDNEHISVIAGKECELKLDTGRGFTLQTYNQRLIQASNEYNTGKTIFQYVPEQSMTDSEVMETRRVLSQAKGLSQSQELFVLDLKKWCLFWRYESAQGIGKMYDELFGFKNLFTTAHTFFVDCNIFSNQRLFPPDYDDLHQPIEGPFYMSNFCGGMEGMHQKRWTHMTISAIKLAMELSDVEGKIIGQGDNQIILVNYRDDQDKDAIRYLFRDNLALVLNSIGHELKEKETWISRRLHEYGKLRIYNGRYVSQATKRACKLLPDSNDILHSIPSCISTINTMTEGLARLDNGADVAFIMNQMLTLHFLIRKNIIYKNDSDTTKKLSLMFPIDFGGLPLSNYFNHLVRGHSDPVTTWLQLLRIVKSLDPDLFKRIKSTWQFYPEDPHVDNEKFTRLIEDIYALNIVSLPSVDQMIKDDAMAFLKSEKVTNPTITRLLEESDSIPSDQIVEVLREMQPFFAQLAHSIYINSNVGLLKRIPSRFTSVRTIESLVVASRETRLIDEITKHNNDLTRMYNSRINLDEDRSEGILDGNYCPTEVADTLRVRSWGIELVALSRPPIQHQFKISRADLVSPEILKRSILIKTSKTVSISPRDCSLILGPFIAYIGSVTDQKVKRAMIDLAQKTGFVKAFLQLGYIMSWAKLMQSPKLMEVVQQLLDEKLLSIDLPPEIDNYNDLFKSIQAGNIGHRFIIETEKPYALINSLPGFATHFHQTSNNMAFLSEGGKDHNIFYQEVYVTNMQVIKLAAEVVGGGTDLYCAYLSCCKCTKDITDLRVDINENAPSLLDSAYGITESINPVQNCEEDINLRFEYVLAQILAKNIDKNYTLNHERLHLDKVEDAIKEQVSVNDFRRVNYTKVIAMSFLYSTHGRKLLSVVNPVLHANVYDLSCIYIAELLSNSGCLGQFLEDVEVGRADHSQLTRNSRLSSLIVSSLVALITQNEEEWYARCLRYRFKEDSIPVWALKKMCHIKKVKYSLINKLISFKLEEKAFSILEMPSPTLIDDDHLTVLSKWRSTKPEEREKTSRRKQPLRVRHIEQYSNYDFVFAHSYFSSRSTTFGTFHIKELSFIARPIGIISSAANKYLEILLMLDYSTWDIDVKTIVSLAEGSGGTLCTLLELFQQATGYYNTLLKQDIDLRDDITNIGPPAATLARFEGRVIDSELNIGETDILTEKFRSKLSLFVSNHDIDLFTMDAESTDHGTNLVFAQTLLPIILAAEVKLIIFKMFFEYDFEDQLNFIYSYLGYQYCLVKPISSNPVGSEIFLVIYHSSIGDMQNQNFQMNKLWKVAKRSLLKKTGLDTDTLNTYINIAKSVSFKLRQMITTHEFQCLDRYERLISEIQCCSSVCRLFYMYLADAIDYIHTSSKGDLFYIVARSGGVSDVLTRMCCDFVFLSLLLYSGKDLRDVIVFLSVLTVGNLDEARISKQPFLRYNNMHGKSFFDNWNDARYFLRESSLRECKCNPNPWYVKKYAQRRSLTNWILKNLSVLGIKDIISRYRIVVDTQAHLGDLKEGEYCYKRIAPYRNLGKMLENIIDF